jgi:hypothetical protein
VQVGFRGLGCLDGAGADAGNQYDSQRENCKNGNVCFHGSKVTLPVQRCQPSTADT